MIDPDSLGYLDALDTYHQIEQSEYKAAFHRYSRQNSKVLLATSPQKPKLITLLDEKKEEEEKHTQPSLPETSQADFQGLKKALADLIALMDSAKTNNRCPWLWSDRTSKKVLNFLNGQINKAEQHLNALINRVTDKQLSLLITTLENIVSTIDTFHPTLQHDSSTVEQTRIEQIATFNGYIQRLNQYNSPDQSNGALVHLQQLVVEKDNQIQTLQTDIKTMQSKQHQEVEQVKTNLHKMYQVELKQLATQIDEKDKAHQSEMKQLKTQINEKDKRVDHLETQINEKDKAHQSEMKQLKTHMQNMYGILKQLQQQSSNQANPISLQHNRHTLLNAQPTSANTPESTAIIERKPTQ